MSNSYGGGGGRGNNRDDGPEDAEQKAAERTEKNLASLSDANALEFYWWVWMI